MDLHCFISLVYCLNLFNFFFFFISFSCHKIITSNQPGPGDHHGCPFKHFDKHSLSLKLTEYGVPKANIDELIGYVGQQSYQAACTRYFEITHGLVQSSAPFPTLVSHPNQYYSESFKLRGGTEQQQEEQRKLILQKLEQRNKNDDDFDDDDEAFNAAADTAMEVIELANTGGFADMDEELDAELREIERESDLAMLDDGLDEELSSGLEAAESALFGKSTEGDSNKESTETPADIDKQLDAGLQEEGEEVAESVNSNNNNNDNIEATNSNEAGTESNDDTAPMDVSN